MWYRSRTYILREEVTEGGTRYFISFKDGQGISYELNVSYDFYMAFRRLELDNRKLENWDWRRFLLYHEYDLNYYQIGAMEHCTPQAVRRSIIIAKEKIKAQMKEYLCA